jgi:hypothetical protein
MASFSRRRLWFNSALPGESDTKQFFFSLSTSVFFSQLSFHHSLHIRPPAILSVDSGTIADCSSTNTYPYPTSNIEIHVIKFKVCIVFVCLLTPNKMRNCTKYAILAVNRMLPLMKFTSSEVNFGRREVVNPSALLFASTLSFTTLG